MELRFWAATDVGRVRGHNEDNFLVDKKLQLFVVCDGMGGHAAGEVASAICVRTVRDVVANEAETLTRLREKPSDPMGRQILEGLLGRAIRTASARIFEMAQKDARRRGMGTTCIALVMMGNRGFVGHVGDSRLYRVRNQEVEQVSIDHSLLNEMIRQGKIPATTTEAEFPHNNAVTRAVGVREAVEVETFQIEVQPGDRLMLCSDGLSEYLRGSVDLAQLFGAADPKETTTRCIEHANLSGGKDNITVVVVDYGVEEDKEDQVEGERVLELLRKTPYFHYLAPKELEHIRGLGTRIEFDADEAVVDGERNRDQLFIVLKGSVSLQLDGNQVSVLMAGEHFGEMALIDAQDEYDDRMVVRTLEPTLLFGIARDKFMGLLRSAPSLAVKLLWNYVQVFADRLQAVPMQLRFTPDEWRSGSEQLADETPPAGVLVFEDDLRRTDGEKSRGAVDDENRPDGAKEGPTRKGRSAHKEGATEERIADEEVDFPGIEEEVELGNLSSLAEISDDEEPGWDSRATIDLGQVDFSYLSAAPPRLGEHEAREQINTPSLGPLLEEILPPTGAFPLHPEKGEEAITAVLEMKDDKLEIEVNRFKAQVEERTLEIGRDRIDRLRAQQKMKEAHGPPAGRFDSFGANGVPEGRVVSGEGIQEDVDPNETLKPSEGLRTTVQLERGFDGPAVKSGHKFEVEDREEDLAETINIGADIGQLRSLRTRTSEDIKERLRQRMNSRPSPTAEVLRKATSPRVTLPFDAAKRKTNRIAANEESNDRRQGVVKSEGLSKPLPHNTADDELLGFSRLSASGGGEDLSERVRKTPTAEEPTVVISQDLMGDADD